MKMFEKNTPVEEADQDAPRPYKAEILAELIDLDRDVMKLLVRRAKLLNRLRGGKDHAATPAAARAEKDVRTAWEKNATAFSRDEKFARQLFSLLQEVRVESHVDASARSGFNLAPSRRPVTVNLPGPGSVTATRLLAVLASWFGNSLTLENILLNDPLMSTVKALNSAGAGFTWTVSARAGEGTLRHTPSGSGVFLARDKALYIGEDILGMYLMAFLAASQTGKARFTGGSGLKMADLSPLRRFLPTLGARLAHSVPKSNGLPGSVEASGQLPDYIVVPHELCREGLIALFCAVAAWRKKVSIDCAALPLPLFTATLAECLPVLRACSVTDSLNGTVVVLDATDANVSEHVACPLDPLLSAYLLALPGFAGGTVALAGKWDAGLPFATSAQELLQQNGLAVQADAQGVRSAVDASGSVVAQPLDLSQVEDGLIPLGLAFAARQTWKQKAETLLPLLPEAIDMDIVEGFYAHVGLACRDGKIMPGAPRDGKSSWTSPSPEWSFAYALCSYDASNIQLTNPFVVTGLMPSFWALFNALPDPSEVKAVPEKEEKTHRRIRTR